jgi:hypothetical protein
MKVLADFKLLPWATIVLLASSVNSPSAEPAPQITDDVPAERAAPETRVTESVVIAEAKDSVFPRREPHAGVQENLFAGHNWYTPPPAPPPVRRPTRPVKREPVAPALPYTLLGIYEQEGSQPLYLLVRDDRVLEVSIGDTLDGTYSVDGVVENQLMLTYLPLNTSQGIRLGEKQ